MKNITIKMWLSFGFGLLLILLLIVAGVGISGLQDAYDGFSEYRGYARQNDATGRLQGHILTTRIAIRGLVHEFNEADAKLFEENRQEVLSGLKELDPMMDDPEEKALFQKLSQKFNEYLTLSQIYLSPNTDVSKRNENAKLVGNCGREMRLITEEIQSRIKSQQDATGPKVKLEIDKDRNTITVVSCLAVVAGMGSAAFVSFYLSKRIKEIASHLNSSAQETLSAAGQMSMASQSLAEGASEQAASLEETSASLEELTSMTRKNAENASQGNLKSSQTRQTTEQSAKDMTELNQAMGDIAKIVKSIDEIAFQTNILALNAAVEAARAGEAGAGFAVVADEVRNLAKRSADAAKETSNKIEAGISLTSRVKQGMDSSVEEVREVDRLVAEIATASKEQAQGIDQINIAIAQMDKVTQSSAATAEETASAAEELNAQSTAMMEYVRSLLQIVGSDATPQRTSSVRSDAPFSQQKQPALRMPVKSAMKALP